MPAASALDFAGRVAIVTGAARGLGRAAAARLVERGASVAVNVRGDERAAQVAREIGGSVLALAGDIAVPGVPDAIVQQTGKFRFYLNIEALP